MFNINVTYLDSVTINNGTKLKYCSAIQIINMVNCVYVLI